MFVLVFKSKSLMGTVKNMYWQHGKLPSYFIDVATKFDTEKEALDYRNRRFNSAGQREWNVEKIEGE